VIAKLEHRVFWGTIGRLTEVDATHVLRAPNTQIGLEREKAYPEGEVYYDKDRSAFRHLRRQSLQLVNRLEVAAGF
jgi:hypothetical protein